MRMVVGLTLVVCALALGCGSGPPPKPEGVAVRGKARLADGSPLTGGVLTFRPDQGVYVANGVVQPDGTFELKDSAGSTGIVPGKYQVFVRFHDPKLAPLAKKVSPQYQNSEDNESDVVVDIDRPTDDLTVTFKR